MKKILYITYVDYLNNAFPGVQDKISGHIKAFQTAGYHVDRINQYGKNAQLVDMSSGDTAEINSFSKRFAILKAVKSAVQNARYVAAYIRFQFFSEDVYKMVTFLKNHGVKVLMEIPTFPYERELHQQGTKGEIKLLCDRMFRGKCANQIDTFVIMSKEIEIYGRPCIHIVNGLNYAQHPLRQIKQPQKGEVHCVAVASMMIWQGYDRFLTGLANYYAGAYQETKVVLHLVGDGREIPRYRELVEQNNLHDRVIFHGMQDAENMRKIASECDIAVGTLGAFRKNLHMLSTLKSREYCAWGLPSINCTETDILDYDDPYVLFVPEDESPIDINEVVRFFNRVYFESGKSAEEVAQTVRSKAMQRSDFISAFEPVINYIRE